MTTNKGKIAEVVEEMMGGIVNDIYIGTKLSGLEQSVHFDSTLSKIRQSLTKLLEERDERLIAEIEKLWVFVSENDLVNMTANDGLISKKDVLALIKNTN